MSDLSRPVARPFRSGGALQRPFQSSTAGTRIDIPGPPPPSAEETELKQTELELLREERAFRRQLEPVILRQEGLRVNPATGAIEDIPFEELSPEEQRSRQILEESQTRQLQALRGELPVSPALERALTEEKKGLINRLRSEKGARFAETTGGIATLGEFKTRAGLLREEARRGQITTGESLLLARLQATEAAQTQGTQGLQTLAGGRFGDLSQQFGFAAAPATQLRGLRTQLGAAGVIEQAGLRQQFFKNLFGEGGAFGGGGAFEFIGPRGVSPAAAGGG